MLIIPDNFAQTISELHGSSGVEWLNQLPTLLAECERHWSLKIKPAFEPLSYNYVAPAIRIDGTDVVLKVGVPNPEFTTEVEALRHYNGKEIVQLLDADSDRGILLLEWLRPGTPLASVDDDELATSIAAEVMRQLWKPVPAEHPFPTIARWAGGLGRLRAHFGGGSGPFPTAIVAEAETLFAELIGSMAEPMLLHGDLHHWNILAAERQPWIAIDPKGLVGEREYEVVALLHNRLPQHLDTPETSHMLARRVDQLAEELDFDRTRLRSWGIAHSVLSAWWSYEDHGSGWERAITCAELLSALQD